MTDKISHRKMRLYVDHYRTMLGWQNVPDDELRETVALGEECD